MPLIVLVLAETPEVARSWIASQPRDETRVVIYAYAARWSAFIGREKSTTFFARVGEWWRIEANEVTYWWARDHGFKEWLEHEREQGSL